MVKRLSKWGILWLVVLLGWPSTVTLALSTSTVSNQYTQPEPEVSEWTINQSIPEGYERLAENDTYVLYAHPETLAFKVVDLRSGYVWHSNLDEVTEEDRLNRTWTAFAQSGVSIDLM